MLSLHHKSGEAETTEFRSRTEQKDFLGGEQTTNQTQNQMESTMTKTKNSPKKIADETLDAVSGGPHFKTWDDTYYDYATDTPLTKAQALRKGQTNN